MTRQDAIKWLKAISYIGIYGGLLMPLFFWPVVIFPFVFSKLIFFQALIGLTFPAYLVLAWAEPRYRPKPTLLYLAIISYFIAVGASTIFSVDPLRSWWGNQERMNGLFTLLHFFAWLSMTVGVVKTWPQWRRLLNYEVTLSAFMAIVALLQKPFPRLLSFPAGDRVGGLLDNPIYMASYQIFNLFFLALLLLKKPSKKAMVYYALVAFLDIAAFLAAQSRGALVGLAVGVLVFAIAYGSMTPSKKAKRLVLSGLLLCVVGYGVLFALRDTEFVRTSTFARFTNFTATSRTRFIAWDIAWKGFLERPITGWGFDTYHVLFNQKYNPESLRFGYYETWFDRSHNTIMDVLSMTGLFGLVTFAAVFITLFIAVVRAKRRGWIDLPFMSVLLALPAGYFVQNLFVFDHPAAFSMSYLLFALVIACSSAEFLSPASTPPASGAAATKPVPWTLFAVIQLLAALVVWRMSVLPFRASMLSIQSNTAFSQGRLDEAYRLAKEAWETPTPYLDEQTFLQSRNFISVASGDLEQVPVWKEWHDLIIAVTDKHLSEHPDNVHPHFIYARFLESMMNRIQSDASLADREYKKALALSPKRQQLLYSYARFLVNTNRPDEATELLKEAVALDDEIGESHWLLGIHLLFNRQDVERGAQEIVKSQRVSSRYVLQEGRESLALALAYEQTNDIEGLKSLIVLLPTLPQAELDVYVQIARAMERKGLTAERDRILNALSKIDSNFATRIMPLKLGTVSSIQEALDLTSDGSGIITSPPGGATVATSSGPGPRR
ncbi:O-antigen ligase family protein [Candidatus Uhrbacteria bacterium]|nr:O-antigen ligase family protein [Candidatus Uhrbacteria bacterium]